MSKTIRNFMLGAVVGAAAGAAAGLMLAPDEGSKTRKDLKKKLEKYLKILEDTLEETVDKGKDLIPEETIVITKKLHDEAEARISRIRTQLHNRFMHNDPQVAEVIHTPARKTEPDVVLNAPDEEVVTNKKEKKRNLFRGV